MTGAGRHFRVWGRIAARRCSRNRVHGRTAGWEAFGYPVERGSVRSDPKDGETLLSPGSAEILPMSESAPAFLARPRAAPGPVELSQSAVECDDASALARHAAARGALVGPRTRWLPFNAWSITASHHLPRAAYAAFDPGRAADEIGLSARGRRCVRPGRSVGSGTLPLCPMRWRRRSILVRRG